MGFYDRDYYREPSQQTWGRINPRSVTLWLIIINIAVFILDLVLTRTEGYQYLVFDGFIYQKYRYLEAYGHFSIYFAYNQLQLWRLITFQFLHASPQHLIFNMIGLYFFGPMIEQYLGARRYLVFYLLCGVGGAVLESVLAYAGILNVSPITSLVGASAGIFGILIAVALVGPDTQVMMIFLPVPIRMRTMAWILVGIAAFTVIFGGQNAGGEAGHLGGALVGFLLTKYPAALNVLSLTFKRKRMRYRGF